MPRLYYVYDCYSLEQIFELQEIRVRHGIKITEVAGKIPHDHALYVLLKAQKQLTGR